jgi:cyclic pyranopterin phosphate synthase
MTKMVDIGDKNDVQRLARAKGELKLKASTMEAIREKRIVKGDVMSAAKIAAIQAVKETSKILPLCHPIPITGIDVSIQLTDERVECECTVKARYKTGVEMEALIGVSTALLTVWDMVKYLEKDEGGQYPMTRIESILVVEKSKDAPEDGTKGRVEQ